MADIQDSRRLTGGLMMSHVSFAILQIAVLTVICMLAGVFDSDTTRNQFFGHLWPSALIVVCGVAGLTVGRQTATMIRWEASAAIVGAAWYLLADTFFFHRP